MPMIALQRRCKVSFSDQTSSYGPTYEISEGFARKWIKHLSAEEGDD